MGCRVRLRSGIGRRLLVMVHHGVRHLVVLLWLVAVGGPGVPREAWAEVPRPEVVEVVVQTMMATPTSVSGSALLVRSLLAVPVLVMFVVVVIVLLFLVVLVVLVMLVAVSSRTPVSAVTAMMPTAMMPTAAVANVTVARVVVVIVPRVQKVPVILVQRPIRRVLVRVGHVVVALVLLMRLGIPHGRRTI